MRRWGALLGDLSELAPASHHPYALYGAIGLGALLLAALVAYTRIYKNPVVVRATHAPQSLKHYPLHKLKTVDQALAKAHRRESALLAAGIPAERWQTALRASESGAAAIAGFTAAVGAVAGEPLANLPPGTTARALNLPPLVLRFAEDTAIAAVEGPDLEDGPARALAAAIDRDGQGPRQALVLDLTRAQNAAARLCELPGVRFVVLSEARLRDLVLAEKPGEVLEQTLVEQLDVADLSPYQTAGGVDQDALFFGRERELRTIADRSLRNFLLVGARQMGKSTLLKALHRRLQARGDVEVHYLTLADGDLVHHIHHHFNPDAERAAAPNPDLFARIAAGKRNKPRLFLIDESDEFVLEDAQRDYAITKVMRKLAQDGLAYFVLAGFWELYAATWLDPKHPLLNFAEVMRLGPLDQESARKLATGPMQSLGLAWDAPETVRQLVRGAGGRANLIVLACKAMVESLDPKTRILTSDKLSAAVRGDADLREQLRVLRQRVYGPLHRAIVHQALLLGEATRDEVRAALRRRGLEATGTDFEQAFDRLELGYVLTADENDELRCPVPWAREQIERGGRLEERIEEDVAEWRQVQRG